jgi:uncharacterized damage-inducible protein DinB
MKAYYIRLYSYNIWANRRYFDFLAKLDEVPERIQLMFSHVLTAQSNWLDRVVGIQTAPLDYWEMWPMDKLRDLAEKNHQRYMQYLEHASDEEFNRMVSYVNMKNLPYVSSVGDILTQTANHATYHRAQFALILRQKGIDPPNTDYITFSREISGQL